MKHALKKLIKTCLNTIAGTIGWELIKRGDSRLIVLMYHRILPKHDPRYTFEEPGMVVSPESFRMHLEVIQQSRIPVVSLKQWLSSADNTRPPVAIAITFDDGWLDNYEFAFPLLHEQSMPATVFCVSDFIGTAAPFWPNRILRLLISGTDFDKPEFEKLRMLLPFVPDSAIDKDRAANVINHLKRFTDKEIYAALEGVANANDEVEMMNLAQIQTAQTKLGIEVGSHTRTHLRLSEAVPFERLNVEIAESKTILEDALGTPITGFCFPNGDYSNEALNIVKQHYQFAVTTHRGHNKAQGLDTHTMVRIGVHDDISNTPMKFKARLSGFI